MNENLLEIVGSNKILENKPPVNIGIFGKVYDTIFDEQISNDSLILSIHYAYIENIIAIRKGNLPSFGRAIEDHFDKKYIKCYYAEYTPSYYYVYGTKQDFTSFFNRDDIKILKLSFLISSRLKHEEYLNMYMIVD